MALRIWCDRFFFVAYSGRQRLVSSWVLKSGISLPLSCQYVILPPVLLLVNVLELVLEFDFVHTLNYLLSQVAFCRRPLNLLCVLLLMKLRVIEPWALVCVGFVLSVNEGCLLALVLGVHNPILYTNRSGPHRFIRSNVLSASHLLQPFKIMPISSLLKFL